MKTFIKVAAQGEITVRRIGGVPSKRSPRKDCKPLELENGRFVIGHSETGHHHVLSKNEGVEVSVLEKDVEKSVFKHFQ